MSAEINEIENRGRESQQSNRRLGSRTTENGCEGTPGGGEGAADETRKSKFAKRTWNVR